MISRYRRRILELGRAGLLSGVLVLGSSCQAPRAGAPPLPPSEENASSQQWMLVLNGEAAPDAPSSNEPESPPLPAESKGPAEAPAPASDLVGTSNAPPLEASAYLLQPDDEIEIQVYREPELSGIFRLNPEGAIRHPLLGSIPLAGMTAADAENHIRERLARDYLVNPRVILKLHSSHNSQIVILGEVKKPGIYPLRVGETMTLLQAIANAGGFTDLASPNRVYIMRRTPEGRQTTLRVPVGNLLKSKGRQRDPKLEPNDVIKVDQVVF